MYYGVDVAETVAELPRDAADSIDLSAIRERISSDIDHEGFVARLEAAEFTRDEILDIELSYNFAKFGHRDQYRESGEPYFLHPRAVAVQLLEIRTALLAAGLEGEARAGVTKDGIVLALHHDTVEDTKLFGGEGLRPGYAREISAFRLLWTYGVDVMCGIDALTKVEAVDHGLTRAEAKRASVEKVNASDPMTRRVKQSDRLHNLRTLGATSPAKQRRIVRATQEHYVPAWERDARDEEPGGAVARILLRLVHEAIADLHESWRGVDEASVPAEPSRDDGPPAIDLGRATAYEILDGIPGLTIVERQLVHFAYDIAAYGHTSTEDAGQDGELSFEQIQGATFDLIDEMTRRRAHDWKLIAGSLLRDTVDHMYIFGSDAIPGLSYERVASRNIAKLFGTDVRDLVLSQTRPTEESPEDRSAFVAQLQAAGPAAVVLHMTDAVERLKSLATRSDPERASYLDRLERYYMPMFESFSAREGRYQDLLVRYLARIHAARA